MDLPASLSKSLQLSSHLAEPLETLDTHCLGRLERCLYCCDAVPERDSTRVNQPLGHGFRQRQSGGQPDFRALAIVDYYARECPLVEVD